MSVLCLKHQDLGQQCCVDDAVFGCHSRTLDVYPENNQLTYYYMKASRLVTIRDGGLQVGAAGGGQQAKKKKKNPW